jgi:hypothetical protein
MICKRVPGIHERMGGCRGRGFMNRVLCGHLTRHLARVRTNADATPVGSLKRSLDLRLLVILASSEPRCSLADKCSLGGGVVDYWRRE